MKTLFRASKDWPYHVSSGCVVVRKNADQLKILLLHRDANFAKRDVDSYHLPKGTVEANEPLEHAAVREVEEESGQPVRIIGYLGGVHSEFTNPYVNEHWDRVVHYFVAMPTRKATLATDHEHSGAAWFSIPEALKHLEQNPKQEKMIVERALQYIDTFGLKPQ